MRKHRRGVLTLYQPATPLCPTDYGGTGPPLALALDVTHGYTLPPGGRLSRFFRLEAPLWIRHRGACNGARRTSSTAS